MIFENYVAHVPKVPYNVEPTSHLHVINQHLINAACVAFPLDRKKKRQCYISNDTFELIKKS
eukprot:10168523-Karenia_brevis.AAC.1